MKNKKSMSRGKITTGNLHKHLAPLYLSLAGILSPVAEAETVPDARQPHGPTMGQTANGTPMINITNPNGKGISLNKFDQFNVDKNGVVFNNSMKDGVTKIGGYAVKNAQLQQEASAIISEVTGAKASYINGTMEVFGKKADIIIANENGISVNGATTINANNLTLSTGKVQANNDGTYKLAVDKGNITVTGKGISTEGLGYFDIVSRSAQLEGEIVGKADIKVLAGKNDYDLQNRTHKVRNKGDGTTPAVAIDGRALGSMYGGKIQLISTESGAGVRHDGSIVASKDIDISADGDLILSGLHSEKNISLAGKNVTLNAGNSTDAQQNIIIKALAGATISGDVISRAGTIRIDASALLQNTATLITNSAVTTSIPAIEINVANAYTLSGKLKALDANGKVISNGVVTLKDGDFVVMANGKQVAFSSIVSDAQVVSNSGNIKVNAGSMKNTQGVVLAKKGTLQINLKEAFENSGSISATGDIVIASGAMKNNGILYATAGQTLNLGDFSNNGRMFAEKSLVMNASALNNMGHIGVSAGEMQLTSRGSLVNSGTMSGDNARLTLTADGDISNSGEVISNKQNVTLTTKGKAISNTGKIQGRDLAVTTAGTNGHIDNRGSLSASQKAQIKTASLTNDKGVISSGGDMVLDVDQQLTNTHGGEILADKNLLIDGAAGMALLNENEGWIQGQSISGNAISSLTNTSQAVMFGLDELKLSGLDTLINNGATLQAASLSLENIGKLDNVQGGTLYASAALSLAGITTLNNNNASVSSNNQASLQHIGTLTNSNAGVINSTGKLSVSDVGALTNTGEAVIQSGSTLDMRNIGTLNNAAKATLAATGSMNLNGVTTLNNQAVIVSESAITVENGDTFTNQGIVQAGTDLILRNLRNLKNEGRDHVLLALRNLTIEDIDSLTNSDHGVISAGMSTVLNAIGVLVNTSAGLIQAVDGALTITADSLTNKGSDKREAATLVAGGDVSITATNLTNDDQGAIVSVDKNLTLNVADKLVNTGGAALVAGDVATLNVQNGVVHNSKDAVISGYSILLNSKKLENVDNGFITAENYLGLDLTSMDNTDGAMEAGKTLALEIDDDFTLGNDNGNMVAGKDLHLVTHGNFINNKQLEVLGNFYAQADKDFKNTQSIVTGGNLNINAANITNDTNALLWSLGNTSLVAENGKFYNAWAGNVMSMGDMSIVAKEIENYAGIIRAEKDILLDAEAITNRSKYTEGTISSGMTQDSEGHFKTTEHLATQVTLDTEFHLPIFSSDIALERQAEISAGGSVYINQRGIQKIHTVKNDGGIIQAANDIFITGDLYNSPDYNEMSLRTYLNTNLEKPIIIYHNWKVAINHRSKKEFYTLFDYLNFVFTTTQKTNSFNEDPNYIFYSLIDAVSGSKSPQLNDTMIKIFGAEWVTQDLDDLSERWLAVTGQKIDETTGEDNKKLDDQKFYFVPQEKGEITAGKKFVHDGGTLNNGLAEAGEINTNANIENIDVGDHSVDTVLAGYDVATSTKKLDIIAMGISPLPAIKDMTTIPGMFEVSDEFKKASAAQKNGTAVPTPGSNIVPMFETRPDMIDQSKFTGSDYFFEQVGYKPSEPVTTIGDNYFTSELIRRQVSQSVGSFFAIRDGLEGDALVQNLMQNAGEESTSLNLEMGKPLTEEQIGQLDKDIVWFVSQYVEGVEVLVPVVYLSPNTLKQIETGEVNGGTASIHGGEMVYVDADAISNVNGNISSGGDMALISKGDITNASNGMNAGIKAAGGIYMESAEGSINNNGAAIKAGDDINMLAKNGDINMTASMGRDESGKQVIHAFEDGVTAGGNINMQAKNITSNAADITADGNIKLNATDGSVKFNDLHVINAERSIETDFKGVFSYTTTDKKSVTADAVGANVTAGGKLIIDAGKDVVMEGGSYNAASGSIKAKDNVTVKTSQEVAWNETTTKSREFIASAGANAFGQSAKASAGTMSGESSSTSEGDYESQGSDSETTASKRRPGGAPTGETAGFKIGVETVTETETNQSLTNKNASLNFTDDLAIDAGKTADIGGADMNAGGEITIDAEKVATTKYKDEHSSTHSIKETFAGISGEAHSSAVDSIDKAGNLAEKAQEGQDINAGTTTAEVLGDISNIAFNDIAGASVTIGGSTKKSSTTSSATSENINTITADKITINSKKDTELNGVKINANETEINAGGDVTMNAAKSTTSYETSGSKHNAGLTIDAGKGMKRGDFSAGLSIDYNGSTEQSSGSSTSYENSEINAGKVTVNSGGDLGMKGANIKADTADINVAGDTNIASVQDTVRDDKSRANWGASVGVGVDTGGKNKGLSINAAAHGGGGSEYFDSATTAQQSGISTKNELNLNTGGDVNLAGSHLVSESKTGTVVVGGEINATDVVDHVEQDGVYGGAGAGISVSPTGKIKGGGVNGYVDTVDEIHYSETQKSTIAVDNTTAGKGTNGDINTDGSKLSEVTKDEKEAGNNISWTIGVPTGKKGKYEVEKPTQPGVHNSDTGTLDGSTLRPRPDGNNKPKPKPDADVKPKHEDDAKPTHEADVKPKPDADVKPTPDANNKPKPDADVKPTPDANNKPKPDADVKPTPDANNKPKPDADVKPTPDANNKPKPDADVKPTPDANNKPKPDADVKPTPDANNKPKPDAKDQSTPDGTATPAKTDPNAPVKKWPVPNTNYPVLSPGSSTAVPGMVQPKAPKHRQWNGDQTNGVMPSSDPKGTDVKLSPGSSTGQTGMDTPPTPDHRQWNGDQTNGVMPSSDPNGTDVKLSPGSSTGQTGMDTPPTPEHKKWNGDMSYNGKWIRLMPETPINIYAAVSVNFEDERFA